MKLTESEKQFLINLCWNALNYIFETGEEISIDENDFPPKLKSRLLNKAATFVTLTKAGKLRGCIGKTKAVQALYKDIIENTYRAAFGDPRFPQLQKEEMDDIAIEISILSEPEKLEYISSDELVNLLSKKKPGVILQFGAFNTATFLPQVWEQLPKAEEFLGELCQKAGLQEEAWKSGELTIMTYTVEKF